MIGIIYKLTIIAKYKMDGHRPFYIGQHWCKSKEDFLKRNYPYYGSGVIWNKFLKRLKKDYPSCWHYFVKREILCCVTNEDKQSTLNKLEKYWIKREHSYYIHSIGGCNATEFVENPAKDPLVGKKISNAKMKYHPMRGKHLSEEQKKRLSFANSGRGNPFYGKRHTEEARKRISESKKNKPNYKLRGREFSEETRKKMSISAKRRMSNPLNNPMFGKHHSEETKDKIRDKIFRKVSEEMKKKGVA